MATGILLEFPGVSEDQYRRVMELLGLDDNPPKGGILHLAGKIPNGLRVVDIWESRNAFDQFYEERLTPVFKQEGIPNPPIEYFDIHNVYAPDVSTLTSLDRLGTLTGSRR